MKPLPKSFWIIFIAFVLIVVAVQIIFPADKTVEEPNLIVISDTDTPIGIIQVNYPRWDGSLASEGVQNADGSMMLRGDQVRFAITNWPATVMVYSDLQGSEVLAAIVIEAAPEGDGVWTATVYDSEDGLSVSLH